MHARPRSRFFSLLAAGLLGACGATHADPYAAAIDPARRHAWSENAGWLNLGDANGQATLIYNGANGFMTGFAWAENLGWLKLGSGTGGPYANTAATNWGVNVDADWRLAGYAWSETCGWINFAPAHGGVRVDPLDGSFSGYAWSENAGWIHAGASGLTYRLAAVLPQTTNGVPHWWLASYGMTNDFADVEWSDGDEDGMAAWMEYVAGTDPTSDSSFLGIRRPDGHEIEPFNTTVTLTWYSVEGKIYDLYEARALTDVAPFRMLASNLVGAAGETSFVDGDLPLLSNRFYRVRVRR